MGSALAASIGSEIQAVRKTAKSALKAPKETAKDHLAKSKLEIAAIGKSEAQRARFIKERDRYLALAQTQWRAANSLFGALKTVAPDDVFDRKDELVALIEIHAETIEKLQSAAFSVTMANLESSHATRAAIKDLRAAKKAFARECQGNDKLEKPIQVCGTKTVLDVSLIDGEIAMLGSYRQALDKRMKLYKDFSKTLDAHDKLVSALLKKAKMARVR